MPVKERLPKERRHQLNADQEMELWLGPSHRGSAFTDAAQQRWAWQSNRDRLMQRYACAGKRPWAWWRLEMGCPHPFDHEASTLYEMGLLAPEERAELEHWWHEQYLRAWDPHFFHCEGPGRIFAGADGRRKHLAWADVPKSLLLQWMKEHQRQRRTIRALAAVTADPSMPAA